MGPPMTPAYSMAVKPAEALLGETVLVALYCSAEGDSPGALTFEHGSLKLILRSPASVEMFGRSPNRVVQHRGEVLIRGSPPGGIEDLAAGERRERSFELNKLFPVALLDLGRFELSFSLGDKVRAGPAAIVIRSGPEAVPLLFKLLDDEDPAVRARGAGLLRRMTAAGLDYDAEAEPASRKRAAETWERWWKARGSRLLWNFHSQGASFGAVLPASVEHRRGLTLGGVAFPAETLTPPQRAFLLASLRRFRSKQIAGALRGETRVADREIQYPPEGVFLAADPEVEEELSLALAQLASLAAERPDLASAALIVLRTAARAPSGRLSGSLTRLANAAPSAGAWGEARTLAEGLLDLLDPERVPISPAPRSP